MKKHFLFGLVGLTLLFTILIMFLSINQPQPQTANFPSIRDPLLSSSPPPHAFLAFGMTETAQGLYDSDGLLTSRLASLTTDKMASSNKYIVVHQPTITVSFINRVLAAYHSPAQGKGQALYNDGKKYGIDPVYALAFFMHESEFGTRGIATSTKSLGNIRCSPGYQCSGGFRKYKTWEAGFVDWYQLIRLQYVNKWHLTTVDKIVPIYAPSSENDVQSYTQAVEHAVDTWHAGGIRP